MRLKKNHRIGNFHFCEEKKTQNFQIFLEILIHFFEKNLKTKSEKKLTKCFSKKKVKMIFLHDEKIFFDDFLFKPHLLFTSFRMHPVPAPNSERNISNKSRVKNFNRFWAFPWISAITLDLTMIYEFGNEVGYCYLPKMCISIPFF